MKSLLFKAEMVRAILEGRKTETRRLATKLVAGDKVFVKETFGECFWCKQIEYRADYVPHVPCIRSRISHEVDKWKPSIFMPEKFSRIKLEIVSVHREPLKRITDAGAVAEGAICVGEYAQLWDSINPSAPFDTNPLVWVIKFKRI